MVGQARGGAAAEPQVGAVLRDALPGAFAEPHTRRRRVAAAVGADTLLLH